MALRGPLRVDDPASPPDNPVVSDIKGRATGFQRETADMSSPGIFDDRNIRFEYPAGWALDVGDDGTRTTVTVQSPDGPAFAVVVADDSRPEPDALADEALAALRAEYPGLDDAPAREPIAGHPGVGHDVEFLSIDATNNCQIRAARTPRRTLFLLAQWSDLEGDDLPSAFTALRSSIEETDA